MINPTDENNNPEIQCKFGNALKELDICRLLKESNIRKKKDRSIYEIFPFLLLLVFQNCNLLHFLNSKKQDMAFSKNTYYLRGFNMLTLGWTDGYSFVPAAFNMMASADLGKHIMGAASGIDKRKT